jgi:hypothetical protein
MSALFLVIAGLDPAIHQALRAQPRIGLPVRPRASGDPATNTPFTSPLEGEVGSRSDPGGGSITSADWYRRPSLGEGNTPLPNPPPQGGREKISALFLRHCRA